MTGEWMTPRDIYEEGRATGRLTMITTRLIRDTYQVVHTPCHTWLESSEPDTLAELVKAHECPLAPPRRKYTPRRPVLGGTGRLP